MAPEPRRAGRLEPRRASRGQRSRSRGALGLMENGGSRPAALASRGVESYRNLGRIALPFLSLTFADRGHPVHFRCRLSPHGGLAARGRKH
eukprot:gene6329-4780_t